VFEDFLRKGVARQKRQVPIGSNAVIDDNITFARPS
jgi:hypothetical protein